MDNMIKNSNNGSSLEDTNSFQDGREEAIFLELNKFVSEHKNILKKNEEELKGLYRTITELKAAESEKSKTINSLNEKINQINKENEDAKIKILDYEKDVNSYLEEISNLNDLNRKYVTQAEENYNLSKELELKKNDEIKDLLEQIVNISDELSEKEQNLINIQNELQDKNALINRQDAALKKNEAELEEINAEIKEKNNLIYEQEKKLDDLENQNKIINEQTTKLKELQETTDSLSKELSEKEQYLINIQNELQDKNALINQQDAALKKNEAELEEINAEIKEKNNLIYEQEKKLDDLENQSKIINEQTTKLKEFQETIDYLSKELSEKEQSIYNIQNELSSKESRIQESIKTKDELQKLKETLDDQKKLKEIVENLKSDNSELQEKNGNLENQIQEFLHEINAYKENTSEIEAQKIRMESELQKFDSSLALKDNELKEKENRLNELENLITQIKNDSNKNNNNTSELSKEKEFLDIKLQDLDSLNNEKDKQIINLQGEIKKITKLLKEKLFNEEQLSNIVDNQAQKIADLESKISLIPSADSLLEKEDLAKEPELVNNTTSVENEIEKNEEDNITTFDESTEGSSIPIQESKDNEIIVNDHITLKCKPITSEAINSTSENGSFEHFQYGEISVIELNISRATLEIAALLRNFLSKIVNEKYNKIIMDLTKSDFVDSTILGVLVSTLKKARGANGDLKIVWCDQAETSMFYVTRMDRVFKIYENLNDAIKSYF